MLMYWLYFALHQGQSHCRVQNVSACPCIWDDDYCSSTNEHLTTCMNYHWLCLLCSYNYQKQATAAGVFCCVVASFGGSLPFLVPLDLYHALCQFCFHDSSRKISVFCCEGLVKEYICLICLLCVRSLLAFLYCCLQIKASDFVNRQEVYVISVLGVRCCTFWTSISLDCNPQLWLIWNCVTTNLVWWCKLPHSGYWHLSLWCLSLKSSAALNVLCWGHSCCVGLLFGYDLGVAGGVSAMWACSPTDRQTPIAIVQITKLMFCPSLLAIKLSLLSHSTGICWH